MKTPTGTHSTIPFLFLFSNSDSYVPGDFTISPHSEAAVVIWLNAGPLILTGKVNRTNVHHRDKGKNVRSCVRDCDSDLMIGSI